MDELTEPEARAFALGSSQLLGSAVPQDFQGTVLREVKDRGVRLDEDRTVRYSDTRQGGNLHTDGAHHPGRVPDIFSLFCFRQASSGGALVLVHVDDLLRLLAGRPEVVAALSRPVHFDTRDGGTPGVPRTVRRPVLEVTGGRSRIHCLREYVESGHRLDGVAPLAEDQRAALDVLDSLLGRADLQLRLRLRPGEMAFVDNRAVVHGRTTFEDRAPGRERLLFRVWIAADRRLVEARRRCGSDRP